GRAAAEVKGDLGPARFFVGPFGYEKKPGAAGSVSLSVKLQDDNVQEITGLSVTAPDFSLGKAGITFRQKAGETVLSKGNIGEFTIGKTKGSMNFTVEESGRYNIKAESSFLDLGPFLDDEENTPRDPDEPAMLIEMTAAKMRGADGTDLPGGRFLIDQRGSGIYNR